MFSQRAKHSFTKNSSDTFWVDVRVRLSFINLLLCKSLCSRPRKAQLFGFLGGLFYLDAFVMKLSAVGACKIEAQMVLLLAQLKAMLALKDDYNGSSTVGVRMAHRCASEH